MATRRRIAATQEQVGASRPKGGSPNAPKTVLIGFSEQFGPEARSRNLVGDILRLRNRAARRPTDPAGAAADENWVSGVSRDYKEP